MKKLLGIILLGLLLSGCVSPPSSQVQQEFIDRGMIKIGMNMTEVYSLVKGGNTFAEVPNQNTNPKYLFLTSLNAVYAGKNSKIYLGEATNSNPKSNATPWGNMIGWKLENYRLIKIYDDNISAYDRMISLEKNPKMTRYVGLKKSFIQYSTRSANNTQSTTASTSSINTADKISQSKQICRDLGFKDGEEKFSDCALKMMSIQFETTNKVASASGGTTQEIIVKHKQDYDIFDAMIDMSNIMLSNNKKSSSSSNSNSNTRCVIGKTNPMYGTTTMNCR